MSIPKHLADERACLAEDGATRARVLDLIIERGPITAGELAQRLALTAAAVRRHLSILARDGDIADHDVPPAAHRGRGRPARQFVATDEGRGGASNPYSSIATDALGELAAVAGPGALTAFARTRFDRLAATYRPAIEAAGPDPVARAEALTRALTADGFAATLRPVGTDGHALQLCQGHCPIQAVAEEFPQLCQAETDTFSDLLGVHVQRLATLAQGEHVCTTHVPLFIRSRTPDDRTNEKESDDH